MAGKHKWWRAGTNSCEYEQSWVFILLVLTIFDADADKQWRVSTNGCKYEQEWVGAVITTAAAAPSVNTNKSGGVQTMAGKHKQLQIWTRVGGCSNYSSSSSSICEHKREREGSNDGGQAQMMAGEWRQGSANKSGWETPPPHCFCHLASMSGSSAPTLHPLFLFSN